MSQGRATSKTLPEPRRSPETTPNLPAPLGKSPEVDRLISVYLRTLTSPQTIRTYNTEIRMFVAFAGDELGREALGEVTAEDVSLYREHLLKAYAPATAAKKLAALRRFLTFTYMSRATRINPEALRFFGKSPKIGQDPSYNVLTSEELSRMLSAARAGSYRDYVMLAVMAGAGLREAEVVGLKVGDFREVVGGQIFLRVAGKGAKIRNVPVSPDLWRLVQCYVLLTERSLTSRADACKPVFASREGGGAKPLTTRSVRYIVKKYAGRAGITKAISPHSIRHTVGTNMAVMAVNEAPLLVIQQFLGIPRPLRPHQNHPALHPPRRRARQQSRPQNIYL